MRRTRTHPVVSYPADPIGVPVILVRRPKARGEENPSGASPCAERILPEAGAVGPSSLAPPWTRNDRARLFPRHAIAGLALDHAREFKFQQHGVHGFCRR